MNLDNYYSLHHACQLTKDWLNDTLKNNRQQYTDTGTDCCIGKWRALLPKAHITLPQAENTPETQGNMRPEGVVFGCWQYVN